MLTAAAAAAPLEAPQARVGEPVAISMEQKCPHVYQSEARCLPRRALDEWGRVAATGTGTTLEKTFVLECRQAPARCGRRRRNEIFLIAQPLHVLLRCAAAALHCFIYTNFTHISSEQRTATEYSRPFG